MTSVILVLALVGTTLGGADAQELLASARELYAAAAYEEALATLKETPVAEPAIAVEVERYRALCLFALGRSDAAREAVVKLVEQDPLYLPSEADVPPRVLAMLHEVRRQLLPDMARRSYSEVRGDLTTNRAAAVAGALERIVRLSSDPDVSGVAGMDDLRLLADGFLALAKATRLPAVPPVAAPATPPTPAPAAAPEARIFTAGDTDVVAPDPVEQTLPRWVPNRTPGTMGTFSGYIRVVIDTEGRVESAILLRRVHPLYDADLLRAAKGWRFVPAQRDGKPVRYLKVIQVTIKGE